MKMIEAGSELKWIRSFKYLGEPCPWASLEGRGWTRTGRPVRRTSRPAQTYLTHRREIIEARLILRDEKPGWAWISESDFSGRAVPGAVIPDGVLKRGDLRWAIEVERSKKLLNTLKAKLERLCAEYAHVIYFAPPSIRATLAKLQEAGELSNLDVRPLPGKRFESGPTAVVRTPYEPSPLARDMLLAINEEGVVARGQLRRFLGWEEPDVEQALQEVEDNHCVRRGFEQDGDGGWIWCNRRGSNRSGSDLAPASPPGVAGLMRRLLHMEVRLSLLAEFPGATWVTPRRLRHGCHGNRRDLPDGVLELNGRRYAVIVLETRRERQSVAHLFERWRGEYADVLCYRTKNLSNWLTGLVSAYELDWVDVRDLPTPPEGSPYRTLEDQSPAASLEGQARAMKVLKVPPSYQPTEQEHALLQLATAEGSVSRVQLPRALGCSESEADAFVDRLREQVFVVVEADWLRSTRRGTDASGIDLPPAKPRRAEAYRDDCFQTMEIRLSLGEPVSAGNWKTRREIGKEAGADGGAMTGLPHGAALIDGQWHAVGVFVNEFRRRLLAERLARWRESFPRVRCYCMESDVEAFKRFTVRWNLTGVEVMAMPKSREPRARERQEAISAAVLLKRERQEVDRRPGRTARQKVRVAVRHGELEKPDTCEGCEKRVGRSKLEGRHTDYSRPLEVEWLCTKCHRGRDREVREADAQRERVVLHE